MRTPRSQPAWTSFPAWTVVLVACLVAAPALAQSTAPPYSMVSSDEGTGLFCLPASGSAASKQAAMGSCLDWLESGAGKEMFKMAVQQACQPQGSNAPACVTFLEMQLEQAVAYIEQYSPNQVVTAGDPLAGQSFAFLGSAAQITLSGAAFRGGTYTGLAGTATRFLGPTASGGPPTPGYYLVYSTTASPLTSFQGSDGNTYPVYAILYGGPAAGIPAAQPWGWALLSLAILLVGVLAIVTRA